MDEIDDAVRGRIAAALDAIEREEGARVLYACESGSRAWGFASLDSDYDVRFIYARPRAAYLRLDPPRDVIERPIAGDLDVNGWDLFKALRLLRRSNPPLLEWLLSPVVYREASPAIAALRELAREHFFGAALFHHYLHMLTGNYHAYIQGRPEVILKKYLYVLRPLAAMLFLERHRAIPPTSFRQTLEALALPAGARERIERLVALKAAGTELGLGAPDAALNALIDEHLARWSAPPAFAPPDRTLTARLDAVLAAVLDEAPDGE
jgi:predicted nucleotidyltransferase